MGEKENFKQTCSNEMNDKPNFHINNKGYLVIRARFH
jgi:hypothetical protein